MYKSIQIALYISDQYHADGKLYNDILLLNGHHSLNCFMLQFIIPTLKIGHLSQRMKLVLGMDITL